MNPRTTTIATVCFLAGRGHDWISAFNLMEEFEHTLLCGHVENTPHDLEAIINNMPRDDYDFLVSELPGLLAEELDD